MAKPLSKFDMNNPTPPLASSNRRGGVEFRPALSRRATLVKKMTKKVLEKVSYKDGVFTKKT